MCESLNALEERIGELLKNKKPILIALDGRCAAGKTMLAQKLAKDLSAAVSGGLQESSQDSAMAVIHIDDFFLRPFQRTAERLSEPGGNFDRERFLKEVLLPLRSGEQPLFRPYNCHTDSFLEEIKVPEKKIYIVDEAQKLTQQAQNALLKTLEEPPEYVVIMLLCTDEKALLSTISSRCVKLKMKPATDAGIAEYLIKNFEIEDDELYLTVAFASGNPGKAIRIDGSEEFRKMYSETMHIF